MDCLKSNKDNPEKQMKYLLGQSGGFKSIDFKFYHLALLCQQTRGFDRTSNSRIKCDNSDSDATSVIHICDEPFSNTCGCNLFKPSKLPAVLFQQTYNKWKAVLDLNFTFRQMRKKRVIYLQPLEHFPDFINQFRYEFRGKKSIGFLKFLQDFLQLFFSGCEVRLLDTKSTSDYGWEVKRRHHHKTKKEQLLVSDIYRNMKKAIPKDGYCMIGITWTDLYPSEDLNFVLGEASAVNRSAVFCFGRFEPKAYKGEEAPPPIDRITANIIWRMIKVISHETCHLYGISHCVFFHCSMNESTSLEEALSQPLFMCPICMRKIHKVCQFDILERYEALLQFLLEINEQYPSDRASNAISWLQDCIEYLRYDPNNTDCCDTKL